MTISNKLIRFFQYVCRFNFGRFQEEEFKKFLRMGLIFGVIIGVYWTLRPLKDAIFIQLVGSIQLPIAKTVSVIVLLPLVMLYTRLLEKTSREKMLQILPLFYGGSVLLFSCAMLFVQGEILLGGECSLMFWTLSRALGYFWYLFVESFGSLIVALFWAFSSDVTEPKSAKRGFPLVVAIGQIGGVLLPYSVGGLPYRLGLKTDALSVALLGGMILAIAPLFRRLQKNTPKELLRPFNEKVCSTRKTQEEPGFFEGLKLLFKHRYLLCIFIAIFIYEIIVTIFDFNFKIAASTQYSGVALSRYLSLYGSSVSVVSLLCLLLGISNVTRFLGINIALAMMPVIVGLAFIGFLTINSLSFLFVLMVGAKAINYALNGPALKQLYIPTTPDVRFKAQAWIETFGSRSSKQIGSVFNMSLAPLKAGFGEVLGKSYYLIMSAAVGLPLLILWFFIALLLGRSFNRAVENDRVVC